MHDTTLSDAAPIVHHGALECPRCEWGHLHHGTVEVYDRPEDADTVRVTTVEGTSARMTRESSQTSDNPSSRRGGIRIHFFCETCGDGLVLNISQHKGSTLMDWTVNLSTPGACGPPASGAP